jgi:hypothetical protein
MENDIIKGYREWFSSYCRSFASETAEGRQNYLMKESHTYAVCGNAVLIAQGLALDERETELAEVVGLFHDVGRFPQYRDYRTFRDSISKNHAVLSAKVLLQEQILRGLPKRDRNLILHAVSLHNVFSLPARLPERTLLHSRLIRDADKLDIWRIFIEILALPEAQRPTAAGLGLPETKDYSAEILPILEQRRMVRLTELRTLNDFKLLQLAWIYDLNFLPSFRLVRDRDIVSRLAVTLPRTDEVLRATDSVRSYVEERIVSGEQRL